MKRILLLVFTIIFLIQLHADPPQITGLIGKDLKNLLKINLPVLYFKTYSLQYERSFLRNFSACLQTVFNSKLILDPYLNKILDNVPDPKLQKVRAKVSLSELYTTNNTYFTPEIRIYLSIKGSPQGIYLAPYLRFSSSTVHATFLYKDSNNTDIPMVFKGKLNNT